jgi:type VI secretion system protein ImpM
MNWGYLGKLPARGDFISHGLSEAVHEHWLQWCQAGIAVSREQLQSQWLDIWLTAPLWFFAAEAGVLAPTAMAGALIPSVDRVGRYFPFIVQSCYSGSAWQLLQDRSWNTALATVLLNTLEDNWQESIWQEQLNAIHLPHHACNPLQWSPSRHNTVLPASPDFAQLTEATLRHSGKNMYWHSAGSRYVEPVLLATTGLPRAGQFVSLLQANWEQQQWDCIEPRPALCK